MRWRWTGWTLSALALSVLAGCGAGDSGSFGDVFGDGNTPGSGGTQQYAILQGAIYRRVADGRILILAYNTTADAAQTAVAGAKVEIAALKVSVLTDANGRYRLTGLPAGDYNVTITLPAAIGGAPATFKVRLDAGTTVEGIPGAPTS